MYAVLIMTIVHVMCSNTINNDLAHIVLYSGVEDIVRLRPDLKDMRRPSDNLTALQLASLNSRYYVVRHLALSVSSNGCRHATILASGSPSPKSTISCLLYM